MSADPSPPNPYTPGRVPHQLAGRERELALIRTHLAPVAAYGDAVPPVVFTGVRGMGKTSLLRHAQRELEADGFVTAWFACGPDAPYLAQLETAVAMGLQRTVHDPDPKRSSTDRTVGAAVGLPGLKLTAEVTSRTPEPSQVSVNSTAVEQYLLGVSQRVRDAGAAGLIVIIDEWQAGVLADTNALLNASQNLVGTPAVAPVGVVGAGLPSTPTVLMNAATFAERTTWSPVTPLDSARAAEVLAGPANDAGVSWSADALDHALAIADGNPYILQLIGHSTWNTAQPARGEVITLEHVQEGQVGADSQLEHIHAARWRAATPGEQDFLRAMAQEPSAVVQRRAIAARLGRRTEDLSLPRDRLMDKGIIEPAGRGRLRFTMPGFSDYVRDLDDSQPGTNDS